MSRLSRDQIAQAADWMARLWSEDATDADEQACLRWRQASAENERAWQCLQQAQSRFDGLPAGAGARVLGRSRRLSRRKFLSLAGLGLGAGVLGLDGTGHLPRSAGDNHLATATGEIRHLFLSDGSELNINTATELDLDIDARQRLIRLQQGQIMLVANQAQTPFRILTAEGSLETAGPARLDLYRSEQQTRIELYQGSARLISAAGSSLALSPGQSTRLIGTSITAPVAASADTSAWTEGRLVAEQMPVDRFIHELARYRSGILRVDPALNQLKVSGVFSVRDTDRALDQLSRILPVSITYLTPFLVNVSHA
ncbi:FecR family protein [Marinobacterium lutimaris]|uniref:FecR family protein n=1 Tax=Marinobacterium lutimaris TaxID=568106 RepID=A0A1H6DHS3_9GAMM|nr:FecR domain-containing protein [Marinobacterium lutimaris]SEG84781.1 FecR family protein [Marinobacterium lutimaris]